MPEQPDHRIVVVGGDMAGITVADRLAHKRKRLDITIVEPSARSGRRSRGGAYPKPVQLPHADNLESPD